jgi:proteasome lid subunit RPN8/RPN11
LVGLVKVDAMKKIYVPIRIVEETLTALREAGSRDSEAVLLWLGRSELNTIQVLEAYRPEQEADHDYFRIPAKAMSDLLTHLGQTGTFVAAQVHSHPEEAFHSWADDKWAIVRHQSALSLVVPFFASDTTPSNYLDKIAAFELSANNRWEELRAMQRSTLIEIV